MPNARTLLFLTGALASLACDSPVSPFIGDDDAGTVVIEFGMPPSNWPMDPYILDAARITGDTLVLRVDHGGGCRQHAFALVAWDGFLESVPVQVQAVLAHEDRDDPCDALVRSDLIFDLAPLRAAYSEAYRGEHGRLVLRLSNPRALAGPPLRTVLYEF